MQLTFEHDGVKYACATTESRSIAISLDFEGPQPNHFGTDRASRNVLKVRDFTGDTGQGGSCNVDVLKMIPHCNGTHTETVSHIVDEKFRIGDAAMDVINIAVLVTVKPETAKGKTETYRPKLDDTDSIITARSINKAIKLVVDVTKIRPQALIVRTEPNDSQKRSQAYSAKHAPPFFTVEAITAINELGVRHLLVDFPSIDRINDDGLLTNHHLFWNVNENLHQCSGKTWQHKTITEMIFVENTFADGIYVLNLQVPAFCSDAAPSRPVLIPVRLIE